MSAMNVKVSFSCKKFFDLRSARLHRLIEVNVHVGAAVVLSDEQVDIDMHSLHAVRARDVVDWSCSVHGFR